jgi:hypothetical protein
MFGKSPKNSEIRSLGSYDFKDTYGDPDEAKNEHACDQDFK